MENESRLSACGPALRQHRLLLRIIGLAGPGALSPLQPARCLRRLLRDCVHGRRGPRDAAEGRPLSLDAVLQGESGITRRPNAARVVPSLLPFPILPEGKRHRGSGA